MQRYLQKQQLKQNLFEKRWDVYRDLGSHINTIVHQTSQNSPDWSKLLDPIDQMEHAQFLFGKEVALHERYSNCNARSKKRSELLKVVRQCLGRRWRRLHLDGNRRLGLLLCGLGPSGKAHERQDEQDPSHRGISFVGSRK
jgi:hypothetical protein